MHRFIAYFWQISCKLITLKHLNEHHKQILKDLLDFSKLLLHFYFFIYWLCICIMHTCEVQKATCRSHFSSSIMLSMRIELPLPDLMANAFSLPLFLFIYLLVYLFTCKVSLYSSAWPLAFYEGQVGLKFTAVFLPWPPEFWDFQVWVPRSAYNFPMSKITLKLKKYIPL